MVELLYFQIFQGNMNTYIAELREIDPPMITRRIRFVPISDHPKTICMRVEVYGCEWKGKEMYIYMYCIWICLHPYWAV